ncbi:uncharacterized protein LOC115632939 [Scaptodrosophila lebanonensis]|uniref:Uncharacterized protein LOC115632939 n=1 Tax=Drosophila lebanonensis TaxID=7225 RepID=A0A6J2UCH5_DROLE|nr:uncharacterized protein LOC115632939 [Scaptodrosophila lebanonensis]
METKRKMITRYGRRVRARVELTLDSSMEQSNSDGCNEDPYENAPKQKKPRILSCSSNMNITHTRLQSDSSLERSDTNCSPKRGRFSRKEKKSEVLIFLDLHNPIAIIKLEPIVSDHDDDLKIMLNNFLGILPSKRYLYIPEAVGMDKTKRSHNNSHMEPKANSEDPDTLMIENLKYFCKNASDPIHDSQLLSNIKQDGKFRVFVEQHPHLCKFIVSMDYKSYLAMCQVDSLYQGRSDFGQHKEVLAQIIFHVLNHKIFNDALKPEIKWMSKMSNRSTCVHTIGVGSGGQRESKILLSTKITHVGVLIKAMFHEMCHSAAFVFDGETGHGEYTRKWASKAKSKMPRLPEIGECASSYKYCCTFCRRHSYGNMNFKHQLKELRCHFCQFELIVVSTDDAFCHTLTEEIPRANKYSEFIKKHYLQAAELGHTDKMKELNALYLSTL